MTNKSLDKPSLLILKVFLQTKTNQIVIGREPNWMDLLKMPKELTQLAFHSTRKRRKGRLFNTCMNWKLLSAFTKRSFLSYREITISWMRPTSKTSTILSRMIMLSMYLKGLQISLWVNKKQLLTSFPTLTWEMDFQMKSKALSQMAFFATTVPVWRRYKHSRS